MRLAALRPVFITAALALTTLLAALLALQAVYAERNHRVTAERVLSDYAGLGAEGTATRLRNFLAARVNPVLLAVAAAPGASPPEASALRSRLSGGSLAVLENLTRTLKIDSTLRAAPSPGEPLSSARRETLVALVKQASGALPDFAYFGMAWLPESESGELVVFQPLRQGSPRAAAFTLPRPALSAMLEAAIARDPVLPASLSHGTSIDSGVGVRVTSAAGVLANRRFERASLFRAARSLGPGFGDLSVEISLGESLAPALIIGGLPRSRIGVLFALLGLTVALTIAAADQLRRERELSRLRDDFVASVSHELRTPLAQVRLFSETLRLGRVRSPAEGERSLEIVENEAKRLEHLVENLLHFSRVERGALRIETESVDVSALLQQIASEFAPLAARSESTLQLALASDVHADVDRAAIRQVVLNLLDNAVKYGRRSQVITVRLVAEPDGVRIEVEDQGEGIPADARARVWERFWRGEGARRAGVTGTGIGLAIVGDIVRLHGGSAAAEAAPGGGARIVVRLPRRVA